MTTVQENQFIERLNKLGFKNRELQLPPLLDADPIFAASFLTKEDSDLTIDLLIKAFKSIEEGDTRKNVLTFLITYSTINFDWFFSFTTELCRLKGVIFKVPIKVRDELPYSAKKVVLCPPVEYISKERGISCKRYSNNPNADAVTLWRIKYIKDNYSPDDFENDEYPAWYVMTNTIIYEGYSVKTNTRVKVEFCNGELHYFIAGASDKWKKIIGVPTEMDHIISALIFRS